MTEPDRLPPDQRAVLSLVLDRGKSYAEVAAMLAIPEAAVRERARAALDALARAEAPVNGGRPPAPPSPPPPSPAPDLPARRSSSTSHSPARRELPSSRLGGAVLLAALVAAIAVGVVLLTGGGKGSTTGAGTTPAGAGSTSPSSAAKPRIDKKLTLSPAEPEGHAGGEAYVLSDGSRHAFYVAARGLPPSRGFFYAVWLYNSPSSSAPLGRAPAVGSNGRLEGGGPLPSNAADYGRLIVTRETNTHARRPGTIVLSGPFSLR
jgi:Anti-sigma-K factor rskA/Sigma-70, region 4